MRDNAVRWEWMERFYYLHIVPLAASMFLLDFEAFTRLSLLYTTTVSAVTAGATYGAKAKAERAKHAADKEAK